RQRYFGGDVGRATLSLPVAEWRTSRSALPDLPGDERHPPRQQWKLPVTPRRPAGKSRATKRSQNFSARKEAEMMHFIAATPAGTILAKDRDRPRQPPTRSLFGNFRRHQPIGSAAPVSLQRRPLEHHDVEDQPPTRPQCPCDLSEEMVQRPNAQARRAII